MRVLSLSGGKDSLSILLNYVAEGLRIDHAVFFDGGWEWPECVAMVARACQEHGVPVTTVYPAVGRWPHKRRVTFDYMLADYEKTKGKRIGEHGYGWPGPATRWCTRFKTAAIDQKAKELGATELLIGFAADEMDRVARTTIQKKGVMVRYPLVEWGWTEKHALDFCHDLGYYWGRDLEHCLYTKFPRVSCWCCPLQSNGELRTLHDLFPSMWAELERKQASIRDGEPRFKQGKTVFEWGARFEKESADESGSRRDLHQLRIHPGGEAAA